jgi:hypothetical protein
MGRHPEIEGCDWPRSTCTQPVTQRVPNGGAFCEEHFKMWAIYMQSLLQAYGG